jgi:cytochrome c2
MLKFLKAALLTGAVAVVASPAFAADPAAGEKVFKKCRACHAVGEGAKHKVGPELNDIIGRQAGTAEGFKYSNAMIEAGDGGMVWDDEALAAYLAAPKKVVPKTKMAFAGLKKDDDIENVIAYLKTFSEGAAAEEAAAAPAEEAPAEEATEVAAAPAVAAAMHEPDHDGAFGLGRKAVEEEITAWDVNVMPDGTGLPAGSGDVFTGEELFAEHCAACHGDFAEGVGNWPKLAGGWDTLDHEDPLKTVGSYWPYLSTTWDYVNRSMPFGNAQIFEPDEVYAIVAYILYSNDLVDDEFVLSNETFLDVDMPNADGFIVDDRAETEYPVFTAENACMSDCKDSVEITMRARVLDVTPDAGDDENTGGGID